MSMPSLATRTLENVPTEKAKIVDCAECRVNLELERLERLKPTLTRPDELRGLELAASIDELML